ncbi:MAG: DUF3486 family protein [Proteobacteria bacterium]|nr:DUF3486 family protein [Pseudomonadota bacterium]
MAKRSKIQGLPKEVKAWLDTALVEGNFSGYELLEVELKQRGFDIGKSSIHRYGSQFEQKLATLTLASEQAKAIVAASPDDEGAVSEALMRLVQEKLFQVMLDFEVDPSKPLNIASAAKAVAELSRATVTQKKWQAEIRAKAAVVAADVGAAVKKGGLSDAAAEDIRRRILGIVQ